MLNIGRRDSPMDNRDPNKPQSATAPYNPAASSGGTSAATPRPAPSPAAPPSAPRETAPTAWHLELLWIAGMRIVERDLTNRREIFVSFGREVVPNIVSDRVSCQRTTRVGLKQRKRYAVFG